MNKYVYLLAPNAISFVMSKICPMTNGPKTNSQPPGWVFGVVWPILYLFLGWNWMKTRNPLHILLIALLNYWVYKAGCQSDYRTGAWIFVPIIALSLAIWMKSSQMYSNGWWVMTPLIAWLLFAHQLNVHIVENE